MAGSHGNLQMVQEFVSAAAAAESMSGLRDLIEEASNKLGFDYFSIVHHIRFGRPSQDKVRLSNYPVEWLAVLRENEGLKDPILKAAERTSSGFLWSHIGKLTRLSPQEQRHLNRAAAYGLRSGFTVPNHVPGETFGSCHFAVYGDKPLPDGSLPAAQALGCFAFEAARQLIRSDASPSESYVIPAPLTERQRDCLLLAAKGKTDSVIAQLLNLRPRTVNEHIEAAKRRYSVATRTQLIVRALFTSEICYSEVLG